VTPLMKIEVLEDAAAVARRAAEVITAAARNAVESRGRFTLAVSGGSTPWAMLRALADERIRWERVWVVQVDERAVPEGHEERNLTHLRSSLLAHAPIEPDQLRAMPVEAPDLADAAKQYARTLESIAGAPPVLDLVQLGLGLDGHTASLVPEDPVLGVTDTDVGLTGIYQGTRRMTLTYPLINRSRQLLWVVTGSGKAEVLARLCNGDRSIPAGRVRRDRALVLADRAAALQLL